VVCVRVCVCVCVTVKVFFSELKYTYVEAEQAYTLLALTCDIGGALGLILGSTLLTFCELMSSHSMS